jgi:hypothetical protein
MNPSLISHKQIHMYVYSYSSKSLTRYDVYHTVVCLMYQLSIRIERLFAVWTNGCINCANFLIYHPTYWDLRSSGILRRTKNLWYDIYNCNWVDIRWQQYSSHLHTNSTQNTQNRTYITITKLNMHNNKKINEFGKCGPCPVFASYTLAFALQLRKSTEKPQLG